MIDLFVEGEVHVVEYLPKLGYGVSLQRTATFGWEGVENRFESLAGVEAYVVDLLKKKAPNQPPQPTRPFGPRG